MPDDDSKKNEAELEVRLSEAIRRLFPALDQGRIRHQKILTLKLGHHEVKLDGTKTKSKKGRLDILIEFDGRPLAILELKKPGEALDSFVSRQGLSYARLISDTQMPPLVITSNGTDSAFFKTLDGSCWTADTRDEKALQELFTLAGQVAGAELDKAVQSLLDSIPAAWTEVLRGYTQRQIDSLTGASDDLRKPIAADFFVPRMATLVLHELLSRGYRKLALTGDPLSGKTNALAGLCRMENLTSKCFLYVDLASSSEGIFDQIASTFSEEFFRTFTKEQIRTWLLNQLPRHPDHPLVVLVDGIDSVKLNLVQKDLDTLAKMADRGRLSLVLAGHPESVDALAVVKGRATETAIGRQLARLPLESLNDEEFEAARQQIWDTRHATLDHGADKVIELRQPRLLRLLASKVPLDAPTGHAPDGQVAALILSTPNPRWFAEIWHRFATDDVREDYRRLAEAVLADSKEPGDYEEGLRFAAFTALRVETVEKLISEERTKSLRERGFLQFIYGSDGQRFYLPKVPELLVGALADLIADHATRQAAPGESQEVVTLILEETERLPYRSMTAAMAIIRASERPQFRSTLQVAIAVLVEDPPHFKKFGEDTQIAAMRPDGTSMTFPLSALSIPEDERGAWDNTDSWLIALYVLTQLLTGGAEAAARMDAIQKIGSHPHPLLPMSPLRMLNPLEVQQDELPGGVRVLHGSSAFLEPIIELIRLALSNHPEDLDHLIDLAVANSNIPLLYRLINGIRPYIDAVDREEAARAAKWTPVLDKALKAAIKKAREEVEGKQHP